MKEDMILLYNMEPSYNVCLFKTASECSAHLLYLQISGQRYWLLSYSTIDMQAHIQKEGQTNTHNSRLATVTCLFIT